MRGKVVAIARLLVSGGLVLTGCGGEEPKDERGLDSGGSAGSAGSSSAGTGTIVDLGGSSAGGIAGAAASGSGGGGNGGAGGSASGGTGGQPSGGTGGGTAEPCTPASTEGIGFSGSCLYSDHCSDQYDSSFGAETLQQICEAQSGTWSTSHCDAAEWALKCTQDSFGGVYVQYMPADGFCFDGCEESL